MSTVSSSSPCDFTCARTVRHGPITTGLSTGTLRSRSGPTSARHQPRGKRLGLEMQRQQQASRVPCPSTAAHLKLRHLLLAEEVRLARHLPYDHQPRLVIDTTGPERHPERSEQSTDGEHVNASNISSATSARSGTNSRGSHSTYAASTGAQEVFSRNRDSRPHEPNEAPQKALRLVPWFRSDSFV